MIDLAQVRSWAKRRSCSPAAVWEGGKESQLTCAFLPRLRAQEPARQNQSFARTIGRLATNSSAGFEKINTQACDSRTTHILLRAVCARLCAQLGDSLPAAAVRKMDGAAFAPVADLGAPCPFLRSRCYAIALIRPSMCPRALIRSPAAPRTDS